MRPGFICTHILSPDGTPDGLARPPQVVEHNEPVDENDSGWGLYCNEVGLHENAELRIVDLDRYIAQDPTLQQVLEMPEGHHAYRATADQPWVIEPLPAEPQAA